MKPYLNLKYSDINGLNMLSKMIKMKAWASSFFFFGIDIGYHNASSKSMSFARNRIDRSSVNTRHVNACITFAYARMQAINASSSPG